MSTIKSTVNFILKIKKDLDKLNNLGKIKINKFKSKKNNQIDPVTKLDLKIEKFLRKSITKNFPDHSIFGEEFADQVMISDYKWVIDPIDGTKSMIMGLPTWSNLIGLYKKQKSILSFANFPVLNKLYLAHSSKTLLYEKGKYKQIFSNRKATLNEAKISVNTFHTLQNPKIFNFLKSHKGFFKITGCDAYNFCSIAEGKFDILIESGLKQVDILPVVSIVENAGAIISDWQGKMKFKNGQVLVSSNNKLHKNFLRIYHNY